MSDDRTGRELTPRPEDQSGAVTPREPQLPQPSTTEVDRFYAGEQAHTVGLSEERAAAVVRQSGNARMVAFLGALILVLFIPIYWLYDIGLPVVGNEGRMAAEQDVQYVTDVARGHALYLANCARCHGNNGQGGIGPPLNDQAKLYNTVTQQGLPGPGHLNPDYLHAVLREGGRYVCGDPKSIMPAWEQPKGTLNYREVEEIVTFILATKDVHWTALAGHGEPGASAPPETEHEGWRDPAYSPAPGSTPVPACWSAAGPTSAPSSPAPVPSPGTVDNPRVIAIEGTEQVRWVDPASGEVIGSISIVQGETVEFQITNASDVIPHNFHIGPAAELSTATDTTDLPGVDNFTSAEGTQTFTYTFDDLPDQPQFACTVGGHYNTMHGDFVVAEPGGAPAGTPAGSPPAGSPPAATPPPGSPVATPPPGTP